MYGQVDEHWVGLLKPEGGFILGTFFGIHEDTLEAYELGFRV